MNDTTSLGLLNVAALAIHAAREALAQIDDEEIAERYDDMLFNVVRDIENDIAAQPATMPSNRAIQKAIAARRSWEDDQESMELVQRVGAFVAVAAE